MQNLKNLTFCVLFSTGAAAAARDGRGAGAGGGLAARRPRQQYAGWSRAAQCATLPH